MLLLSWYLVLHLRWVPFLQYALYLFLQVLHDCQTQLRTGKGLLSESTLNSHNNDLLETIYIGAMAVSLTILQCPQWRSGTYRVGLWIDWSSLRILLSHLTCDFDRFWSNDIGLTPEAQDHGLEFSYKNSNAKASDDHRCHVEAIPICRLERKYLTLSISCCSNVSRVVMLVSAYSGADCSRDESQNVPELHYY